MDFLAPIIALPRWVYEAAFVVYAVVVSGLIVLERRRPTATMALILSLIFVPVIGLLAYWLFSRQRVRLTRRRRAQRPVRAVDGTRKLASLERPPEDLQQPERGLVRLALQSAAAPLRRADSVTLLSDPTSSFEALREAIAHAQRSIHLEFYIWRDDEVSRQITQWLADRAKAGVRVRVLYDHLGSLGIASDHFDALRAAGGQVGVFGRLRLPVRLGRARFNFRNHRKIITVDGLAGFVGGLNIGKEYLGPQRDAQWRDLFVRIDGDATLGLEAIFLEDWLASTGEIVDLEGERPDDAPAPRRWKRRRATGPVADPYADPDRPMQSAGPLCQIIPSGPDMPVTSVIGAQFSAAIASASQRCYIATPYFIPDEPLMLILRTAALRGVDVRVLVPDPAHSDQRLVSLASRSYYDELLEVGIRIFEYEPGMLHAKYLIADHQVSAIGSANMDVRSFHINYEVTAMFYDEGVTAELAETFDLDLGRSREITATSRLRLPLRSRLAENFARVLSPLL